jgi:hypothetical protein
VGHADPARRERRAARQAGHLPGRETLLGGQVLPGTGRLGGRLHAAARSALRLAGQAQRAQADAHVVREAASPTRTARASRTRCSSRTRTSCCTPVTSARSAWT